MPKPLVLKPLALLASLVLSAAAVPIATAPAGGGRSCGGDEPKEAADLWTFEELQRQIFFAVLEGLYVDGVSNEAVDAVCAVDPFHGYPANFVQGCPICMPALDAFSLYRSRPPFKGNKAQADTFGAGLAPEELARITTGDIGERQEAIMDLVGHWMERRVGMLRLSPDERAKWDVMLGAMRKKGTAILAQYRDSGLGGSYSQMKECPFCNGANEPFEK
jgi:hypothetical protein